MKLLNRWQEAQRQRQYDLLCRDVYAQEERIAQHYAAFAHVANQLRVLCEERKITGTSKLDDTIKFLTRKIREGHLKEFGIELEWADPSEKEGTRTCFCEFPSSSESPKS